MAQRKTYNQLATSMVVNPDKQVELENIVAKIIEKKDRYQSVASTLQCPWEIVAVIHYRESSLNFNRHLHNGDPLTQRTVRVPKGRPISGNPPFTWEESAIDALKGHGWSNTLNHDLDDLMEKLEAYNGFGYKNKGLNSPYLWSWTNQYTKGKYVGDGKFNPNFVDAQCGVMPLYFALLNH